MATYPWLTASSDTALAQARLNMLAVQAGKCPPVAEDGKLGPNTCGAASVYASDPTIKAMLAACKSSNAAAANGCVGTLPWLAFSSVTESMQAALNPQIKRNGYCELTVDGKLGPNTCTAVSLQLGDLAAKSIGCKSFGTLAKCGTPAATAPVVVAESTPKPVVSTPVVTAPVVTAPVVTAPVVTAPVVTAPVVTAPTVVKADTPKPITTTPAPLTAQEQAMITSSNTEIATNQKSAANKSKAASMDTTLWILLGLGGVAIIGGGTYLALRKKKK